mgnify:CR=1 FL=1
MIEYRLKPITATSYILHTGGNRIAMIVADGNGFKVIGTLDRKSFSGIEDLVEFFGGNLVIEQPEENDEPEASDINGYPIKHQTAHDVIEGDYPSYSKTEGSKLRFAAGYYGVLFTHGWVYSYCPKTTTLDENKWIGPFRTKLEMQNAITQQKNAPRI